MERLHICSGKELFVYCRNDANEVVVQAKQAFSSILKSVTGEEPCSVLCVKEISATAICVCLSCFDDSFSLKSENERLAGYKKALNGTDGFAVLRDENRIYILSHTPAGVYYGAHDFLEKNFDIIFARGAKEYAVEYSHATEWEITKYNYMEKSPFAIRVWNMCGVGSEGKSHIDFGTAVYYARNKINGIFHEMADIWQEHGLRGVGIATMQANHIDDLIEEHPEYFMTDLDGKPKTSPYESYVNYYSKEAAEVVASRFVKFLEGANNRNLYLWIMRDDPYFYMEENGKSLLSEPFIADDGAKVFPEDDNYKSTVYFNFLNRVVRAVNKVRSNTKIMTFAYYFSEPAPATKIDENLLVAVAPISTNEKYSYTDKTNTGNHAIAQNIEKWSKICPKLCIYPYWNSFKGTIYTRPILRQIKENLLWFEKLGVYGITAEGKLDCSLVENMTQAQKNSRKFFDLNEACTWVINKLIWNPRSDISELLEKYAKIVYKETAEEFLKYYRLIEKGFDSKDAFIWYPIGGISYILQFIVEAGIKDEVLQTIRAAKEKAKTPGVQTRWKSICETMEKEIAEYSNFAKEEGSIYRCDETTDVCSQAALDYKNHPESIWNKAVSMRILRNYDNMKYYPKEAGFECKMIFNGKSLFVGYAITDDEIKETFEDENGRINIRREDGSVVESYAETYIGGNDMNQSVYYGYISGFNPPSGKGEFYRNAGSPLKIEAEGLNDYYFVKTDKKKENRYYFHVQEIPLTVLKVTSGDFRPYGSFVYYTNRFHRAGWMGFGIWCKENFQSFKIVN